ncbi:Fe-S oxidoreductase [Dissulfuribacter thermophilus]|uniref:Fe-S oxidoreductase n=1 Tax=Dissulfuribacter thermophilus TaxID=1156395 RepID=A0A1B9F8R9_9BACT|nr:(Fe-S)-binding protein [Dissulfuribacter thermophilus]OCC16316.1 Fe-S oxidoreductase [Dissulfuribacter thermophilus]
MKNYVLRDRILKVCGNNLLSCLHCGSCASVCHASGIQNMDPERLLRLILLGLDEEALNTTWIWRCSLCGRCRRHCPVDIDIPGIIYYLRQCQGESFAPKILKEFYVRTLTTGNVLSLTPFEVIKTLQWLEQELRRISNRPDFSIPIDKTGAEILVFVSSRDLKFNPKTILALSFLLNMAKADWTIPSYGFEESNFAAMAGNIDAQKNISLQKIQTCRNLGSRIILMDSCEHAFLKAGFGPLPTKIQFPDIEILSTPVLIWRYLKKGRLSPPKKNNQKQAMDSYPLVIVNDPCNVEPDSEIYKSVRNILSAYGFSVKTLEPAPPNCICCGGGAGAGLLGLEDRRQLTLLKRKQLLKLKETGILTTYCHQCAEQLREIIIDTNINLKFLSFQELLFEVYL